VRTVTLDDGYCVTYGESFSAPVPEAETTLSLGVMAMGTGKNDLLSVDSLALDAGKGKPGVVHHGDDDSPLKAYLANGFSGGCGGSKSAAGLPAVAYASYAGGQEWIALKNRFFVTALARASVPNTGFSADVARDRRSADYRPETVSARVAFAGLPASRTSVFYVGPKKQSLLWDLGMKDVMEFGMWSWICYPVVWLLNVFHALVPNYGVAIIFLTLFVRLLFWPLTHKSTVGMKRMQEIQPKMKELQARFKDNPQRLQQETWALYREHKVNPLSSCLPMLIQIPVFIALFNVLRSAVELRYAPFLWIADLSEPEALFASWFPFGGLNVLPVLMAVTTGLQSAFTPSTGDRQQQRMMMVVMPAMMLFMFYSFPSALSLYWFLSNLFSIVQMWMIRRSTGASAAVVPEVIDPPVTRQMRRHQGE
jgi:YidC/Oxa1 family membrane protein insertase